MFNPSYLTISRHRIYYFRWPLPRSLHPSGKIAALKVSLRTRDPKQAISLARHLGYVAQVLILHGASSGMDFDQIRALLTEHFRSRLMTVKSEIAKTGRLSRVARAAYENSAQFAQDAVSEGWPLIPGVSDARWMDKLIEQYGASVQPGTEAYERLRTEAIRAHRDYCSSVLDYDRSLESYDFTSEPISEKPAERLRIVASSGLTLLELTNRFTTEGNRGEQWVAKTRMEKAEHIALLHEVLGEKTDVKTITSTDAQSVKSTLTSYPKNRKKNPKTRGLSLEAVLKVTDVERLNVRTLNKYLQAYNSLFGWAKRNGYVQENVFDGLAVRQGKNKGKQVRTSFSNEQVARILHQLLNNQGGFVRLGYQKWGPLIALYTGARLNEIAQMHLTDIRMQDGVWCFDINDNHESKKLKTDASRRLVPMHSQLIALGFIEYVQSLEDAGATKLFPKFTYCQKNGWGRSLGRWFNDEFLVRVEMKGQGLSFHSFRHTVVTGLIHSDVDLPLVQTLVGHERQGVTLQHYFSSGFKISQLREALEKLDYSRA